MDTGDAAYIKQHNRRILIGEIIKNKSLSRSDLARITGLNKATVSAQVNTLMEEGIVIETFNGVSKTRGRKPILIEMNGKAGFSIGIDIDETTVKVIFTDLKGKPFLQESLTADVYEFPVIIEEIIRHLSPIVERLAASYQPIGLTGIGIGIHGIVNDHEEVIFTPKQPDINVSLKESLQDAFACPVYIDNNANMSAFAEQVYEDHISDLFCITLYSGIGLGIISDHQIYRGYRGFAGEIGHMIIHAKGLPCSCGNHGCWELYASERSLMKALSATFPDRRVEENVYAILNEPGALPVIDQHLDYLAAGLNNVINIFNPEKIILNGTIINNNSPFIGEMERKLHSKMNDYKEIRASRLGAHSCAFGGAAYVLRNFYDLPTIDFTAYQYIEETTFIHF